LAAGTAPAEITYQFVDLVDAEDRKWCVVGVAARMSDLVWFDSDHRFVAGQAGGYGGDHR
jgi:hypothetical protein